MRFPAVSLVFLCSGLVFMAASLPAQGQKTAMVTFKVFPAAYRLLEGDREIKPEKTSKELRYYRLAKKRSFLVLSAEGYKPYAFTLDSALNSSFEAKLEKQDSPLSLLAELPSGHQPKSVCFTPDGKYLLAAQLSGKGIDVYGTSPMEWMKEIDIPPPGAASTGFVEFAMLPWRDEIWVSQMTSGQVHVLGLSDLEYKESFSTRGIWSKVILADQRLPVVLVSNWVSEDISLIDPSSRKVIRKLKCQGIPRGMALSPDASCLYAANYSNGSIEKFDTATWQRTRILSWGRGAKRHLISDPDRGLLYASDMELGEVWVVNMKDDSLVKKIPVGPKLNTMDISRDRRYLFISSRGTNNPETYLKKGPDLGTLSVLDTRSLEKIDWVWGRNQPTGVAVHPVQDQVAFTDFLDDNIEVYDFSGLYKASMASPSPEPLPTGKP